MATKTKATGAQTPSAMDKALDRFADMMIEKIKDFQDDWHKPWFSEHSEPACNIHGRLYNNMNQFMLCLMNDIKGYELNVWVTSLRLNQEYNQDGKGGKAKDKDGNELPYVHILKGEKMFPVFYTAMTVVDDNGNKIKYDDYKLMSDEQRKGYKVFPKMLTYNVINVCQTNLKEVRPDAWAKLVEKYGDNTEMKVNTDTFTFEPIDDIVENQTWLCPINLSDDDEAYYSINKDAITFPTKERFEDSEYFYSNLLHEMAHSTGAEKRLNRLKPTSFDSKEYATEELVAEMTAAVVCNNHGMVKHIKEDSVAYLKSWLSSLKKDPKYIKTLLCDVKRASQMIEEHIGTAEAYDVKNDDEVEATNIVDANVNNNTNTPTDNAETPQNDTETPSKSVELAPVVRQYYDLKKKHPDALFLFRCGDFYETYANDAKIASEVLAITLTKSQKTRDKDGKPMMMAGFPHHALDTYLPKLIRAGKRVAICDQIEEPKKTVKRCITEIVK